jgi:glycerophosphoryl diester phosphodiesterase
LGLWHMEESCAFEVQGHRGARGLKPENTLPSFEAAFDAGAASVETDVHLTRDGVAVLIHDRFLSERIYRLVRNPVQQRRGKDEDVPAPDTHPPVSELTLRQLRSYRGDLNPDRLRFPGQDRSLTPLTRAFGEACAIDAYAVPTLAELFAFAEAYAGEPGSAAGKTDEQRARVRKLRFDLEIKSVPFLDGDGAGVLEAKILEVVRAAGVLARTTVRSFDHRRVCRLHDLEPGLTTAVLVAGTAPVDPVQLVAAAEAQMYCPEYQFLDELQVRQLHAAGIRVLPWTVNNPEDWSRLCNWGVDGITTDYPDRLASWYRKRAGSVSDRST